MGNGVSTSPPVTPEGVGSVSYDQDSINGNGHLKAGSLYSQRGGKGENQDAAVLCQGFMEEYGLFCGVFDGHGKDGHVVSKKVGERLPFLVHQRKAVAELDIKLEHNLSEEHQATNYGSFSSNRKFLEWSEAFVNAFREMDMEIKLMSQVDCSCSGTTAVVVLKQGEDLLIANLGDSRALLGTKAENGVIAVQLTTDLKPNLPDEADRIRRSNGRVFALRIEPGVQRVWLPRVNRPGMAMSRCFGDFDMKNHGIISTPVVSHHRVTSNDLFVVLATDGVWDVLSNEEVASIVWEVEDEKMAAKAVVDAAIIAWKRKFPLNKPDDCTALCIFLQRAQPQPSCGPPNTPWLG